MVPIVDGLLTGLVLQLAIGPVFFYLLGITLDSSYLNSVFAVIGITLADLIYILLSIFGIGKFLQKPGVKPVFGILSAVILVLFGISTFVNGLRHINPNVFRSPFSWNIWNSFLGSFLLTISSPLTIVFWTSIFTSKAIERDYKKRQLLLFGLGANLSTPVFLLSVMLLLSLVKSHIPDLLIRILNVSVGIIIIVYGVVRIIRVLKPAKN